MSEIDKDIIKLKEELIKVEGSECEVYSRVVGYYRPVKKWNKGKRAEYKDRLSYKSTGKIDV